MLFKITSLKLFVFISFINIFSADAYVSRAKSAYLLDYDSGSVLYAKNENLLMPPSSMVKLMTLTLLFDEIKSGNIKLEDQFPVSKNADFRNRIWQTASKICLEEGRTVSVKDLILGIIVLSGGDASVVVAEKIAGSEDVFVQKMQEKAKTIGMENSVFANVSGLPHPDSLMTTKELGILGKYIISNYPDLYPMFATRRFEYDNHSENWCRQWGRLHTLNYNKLLFIMSGADGMKTGHTDSGGYGMVASVKQNGRRLVGVVNGMRAKDHSDLANEVRKMFVFGFNSTKTKIYYKKDSNIINVPVWYGKKSTVSATVKDNFAITLSKDSNYNGIRVLARYYEPAIAPISRGDKLGEIIAEKDGKVISRKDLIASDDVPKVKFIGKIIANIKIMILGKK